MYRLLPILLLIGCSQRQPRYNVRVYTSEEACKMEMQSKIDFARRISPIIDRYIAEKKKDSAKIYLDSLHVVCGASGSKEWLEFMSKWNYIKYGVKPKSSFK